MRVGVSQKRRTYVRLLLTQVRLSSLPGLVVHFAIEYNFAESLADLVQSETLDKMERYIP